MGREELPAVAGGANAVHLGQPGNVEVLDRSTGQHVDLAGLERHGTGGRIAALLVRPFALTAAKGAATSIHLATAPDLAGVSGGYFAKKRPAKPSAAARDAEAARRLWEESARLVGLAD